MNYFTSKIFFGLISLYCLVFASCSENGKARQVQASDTTISRNKVEVRKPIDTALYKNLLAHLSNGDTTGRWPVKDSFPPEGAILPFNRIIAYYGNLYSKNMGILGELPKDSMFKKLKTEVEKWQKADTLVHVVPALHYIAVTAQGSPGT